MKYKTIKTAAMACLALGLVSCADELNIKSIDKKYSTTYTVEELLAKQYGSLGLTGQKGATGDGDVTDKEDESGYYRTVFNLQELNSDEILWAWLENPDMSPICYFGWNKNSQRANWCYQRLAYNITLYKATDRRQSYEACNEYRKEYRSSCYDAGCGFWLCKLQARHRKRRTGCRSCHRFRGGRELLL